MEDWRKRIGGIGRASLPWRSRCQIGETRRRVPGCGLSRRQEGEMGGWMLCMRMLCHEGETGKFCLHWGMDFGEEIVNKIEERMMCW